VPSRGNNLGCPFARPSPCPVGKEIWDVGEHKRARAQVGKNIWDESDICDVLNMCPCLVGNRIWDDQVCNLGPSCW
jgi:hypothetical protein